MAAALLPGVDGAYRIGRNYPTTCSRTATAPLLIHIPRWSHRMRFVDVGDWTNGPAING